MDGKDTAARHRNGAVPEVERDGSETLYGIEHWTQVRTDPVIEIVEGTDYGETPPGQLDGVELEAAGEIDEVEEVHLGM